MFYEVIIQFAKANAPSFTGFKSYLIEAKDYFNMRSRVATNPKEITDLSLIDKQSLRIIFRSQEVLNISQISRSLRVFSMYLADETHPVNFSNFISGKRLFKMKASEFVNELEKSTNDLEKSTNELNNHSSESTKSTDGNLVLLKKIIEIMMVHSENDNVAKTKIDAAVEEYYGNRRNDYVNN